MEYTKLGNSELNVSKICLGTMGFGAANAGQHTWTIDEEQTKIIIKRALELGINFIDRQLLTLVELVSSISVEQSKNLQKEKMLSLQLSSLH